MSDYFKKLKRHLVYLHEEAREFYLLIFAGLLFGAGMWWFNSASVATNSDQNTVTVKEASTKDKLNSKVQVKKKDTESSIDKIKNMAGGVVGAGGELVNTFGKLIGDFFNFELPDGSTVSIPQGGVEEAFLESFKNEPDSIKSYHILDRVYFKSGSSQLNQNSDNQIGAIASILKAFDKQVLLRGHTDNTGKEALNEKLSLKRAESLREALVARGVKIDIISVYGLGELEPISDNDTVEGRLLNRRIDISVTE